MQSRSFISFLNFFSHKMEFLFIAFHGFGILVLVLAWFSCVVMFRSWFSCVVFNAAALCYIYIFPPWLPSPIAVLLVVLPLWLTCCLIIPVTSAFSVFVPCVILLWQRFFIKLRDLTFCSCLSNRSPASLHPTTRHP